VSRVVVVTGASGGVGRATARELARRGDRVALLARGEAGLRAAAEVESLDGVALPISVDVADAGALEAGADRIESELGPIDVWVNNAFSSVFAPFPEISPKELKRTTEVTYLGTAYGTHAALTRMLPRDRGTIVLVGSALSRRGIPLQAGYCAAKHAIYGLYESIRCELHERSGVRITMVQLPAVNTPQFDWVRSRLPRRAQPVPPIYQPEVAARAIAYAADHPRHREYLIGASTLLTVTANKFVPGLLDPEAGVCWVSSSARVTGLLFESAHIVVLGEQVERVGAEHRGAAGFQADDQPTGAQVGCQRLDGAGQDPLAVASWPVEIHVNPQHSA
jgi:NAD(P)-dependent dehydrogenase (short-subunit alcohol dehydrogenase family)